MAVAAMTLEPSGAASLRSGDGPVTVAAAGAGKPLLLSAETGNAEVTSGADVKLTSLASGAALAVGGDGMVNVAGGNASNNSNGAAVTVSGGTSAGGIAGNVVIGGGDDSASGIGGGGAGG